MDTLFSSRASIFIEGQGTTCEASWPFGSIELDAESMTINALFKSYRLYYRDIDRIRFRPRQIQITHRASDVPSFVTIWGRFGLSRRLQEAIQQHQIQVRMEK
jgi:hypothetical protein